MSTCSMRRMLGQLLTYLLTSASYLSTEKLLVFTWHIDEPEGCQIEQERAGVQLVDLHGRWECRAQSSSRVPPSLATG